MNRTWSVFGASVIGAGLMFLLDPATGARRRSLVRDQVMKTMRRSRAFSGKAARDIGHRAKGLAHEVHARRLQHEGAEFAASDQVLHDRVRSKMGHIIAHPGAVDVVVEGGNVTLSGCVLQSELARLLSVICAIPGVEHVDNQLEAVSDPTGVPSLQGGRHVNRFRQRMGAFASPTGRVALGVLGAMIAAYGIQRLRHASHGDGMPLGRPIAAEIGFH